MNSTHTATNDPATAKDSTHTAMNDPATAKDSTHTAIKDPATAKDIALKSKTIRQNAHEPSR